MNIPVPEGLKLFPFQEEGVRTMLAFLKDGGGCYNASDIGCGKTPMTIATLNTLQAKKLLIICPSVMRLVWRDFYLAWNTVLGQKICTVLSGKDIKAAEHADVVIISYGLAAKEEYKKYLTRKIDAIILDESHAVKNRKAIRTKIILGHYWKQAKYRICLSATPCTNSIADLYTTFSQLAPIEFPNFFQFVGRYSFCKFNGFGKVYYGVRNPEELSQRIRSKFFLRYKKEEVLKDLPSKTWQRVSMPHSFAVETPSEDEAEVNEELTKLKQALELGDIYTPKVNSKLLINRQELGLKKCSFLNEFAVDILEQEHPLVIFTWHRAVSAKLKELLSKYNPVVITGETPAKERHSSIAAFQEGKTNLFIANIISAGIGITLTRANICMFAEYDYSPSNLSQAAGRLCRIGQTKPVTIYYPVVEGSLEEKILKIVMTKLVTFEKVMDEKHQSAVA